MARTIALLATLLLLPRAEAKPPNIIILMMDDLGYGDVGSYGAKDVATPNIDRLARQGVRLTDCYAAAPLCTPTRAAFMTGRYQHRVGLEHVITHRDHDEGLSPSEPTIPRLLKNSGYATGLIGKWHLGLKPEFHPNRHGFDEFFGFLSGAVDYYTHVDEGGGHDLYENDRPVTVPRYLTEEIARRAVSFIDRHATEPFFLDVAFNATHWPFQPPDGQAGPLPPVGNRKSSSGSGRRREPAPVTYGCSSVPIVPSARSSTQSIVTNFATSRWSSSPATTAANGCREWAHSFNERDRSGKGE